MGTIKNLALLASTIATASLAWGRFEADHPVRTERVLPILPPHSGSLRILHVSDPHLIPGQERLVNFLRSQADCADFVVSTGDNMGGADGLEVALRAYEPLLDLPGAFVFGSNDYYSPRLRSPAKYLRKINKTQIAKVTKREKDLPWRELATAFKAAGWKDLSNASALVEVPPGEGMDSNRPLSVALTGVDDPHLNWDKFAELPAGWERADLRLALAHAPYRRVLDGFAARGADLTLAGHTHGGQWCLPGFGALVTNCDLDRHHASGLFRWPGRSDGVAADSSTATAPGQLVNVTRGLGTSPYTPLRYACRPEVVLLTLIPRQ